MNDNETTALVPQRRTTLAEAIQLAEIVFRSQLFPDIRSAAQAVVKIMAGAEMGFGPFASLADVHFIEGKPSLGAHLRAAAIKRSQRYDYKVLRLDNLACELEFRENGEVVGRSDFTWEEAVRERLVHAKEGKGVKVGGEWIKTNWFRTPRNMLFARALSNGYRWYTPNLSGGVLSYEPEEMEEVAAPVDARDVVDAEFSVDAPTAPPSPPALDNGQTRAVVPAQLARPPLSAPELITSEQKERIDTLQYELGVSQDELASKLVQAFGFGDPARLTFQQAGQVLRGLEARKVREAEAAAEAKKAAEAAILKSN